jgi:antitoxin (DNA-binding transcriptional repressor) of toxin-antitoxin stability system
VLTLEVPASPDGLYADHVAQREELGIQETRDKFRDRVDAAIESGTHTVVKRHGRLVAVLVPIGWYREVSEAVGDPMPSADTSDES